jgi:glyoxylase-like metal-dependent hydrolase (beta-lactamase superfamily II)
MASTGRHLPTSKHFRLEQLLDGVYAAIGIPGSGSGSNAGIIDLGDRTLVFDTFLTPQAGDDLRAAAEHLTGRPVAAVINSHWHADHIHGNQAFALVNVPSSLSEQWQPLSANWRQLALNGFFTMPSGRFNRRVS